MTPDTVSGLLQEQAAVRPDAAAVTSSGGVTMTYRQLAEDAAAVARALSARDIGREDRVLVTAPNTPSAVVGLFGAMSAAIAIPVDPSSTADHRGLCTATDPSLVISVDERPTTDWPIPRERVVALDEMVIAGGPADPPEPDPGDLALLMATSGSIGAPHMVALPHDAWIDGARRVIDHFSVNPADRTVNLMPLFHNHGLNGTVAATLLAGGTVMCPGSPDLTRLDQWLIECLPTWLTAAPTVHAALRDVALSNPEVREQVPLRVIRSASASLSAALRQSLEDVFRCPVVEIWGLTEAGGQVTVNPIDVEKRRSGTVGTPAHGFEIVILDEAGRPCSTGDRGEICLRGGAMSRGYFADSAATAELFHGDVLRTKDIGSLDAAGYLRLEGRIADTVNRGGDKVWLPDVDAACVSHPGVASAMAFAVPHPRLGQDIAVAVVPEVSADLGALDVRNFLVGRLAARMVPRRIEIMTMLPVGPTGKPSRRLLEELFAPSADAASVAASSSRSPVAVVLNALWKDILQSAELADDEDFLAAGGDSILATKLVASVSDVFDVDLTVDTILGPGNTVEAMATIIQGRKRAARQL